ncbi:MAG TPA: GreA/GreB family elongation factor [Cyclobacteriaceae bacterium]
MQKPITVTDTDYRRIMTLPELASLKAKMPEVTKQLMENLDAAKLLPQRRIKDNIITMNSRIQLESLKNGLEAEITITYPQDADPRERLVSVFSEIGLALLGRKENDVVSWKIPNGIGVFKVKKVTYQPEAAGDYSL